MKKKLRVGILGATGLVGQRFVTLLEGHPWFDLVSVAASPKSAGKRYAEAIKNKWSLTSPIPSSVKNLIVRAVEEDSAKIMKEVDFVFCALDMDKENIKEIEIRYAKAGIPVISNNSAHRWTEDVPMIIPEVNPSHVRLIDIQRKMRKWEKGFIAVKPNCSIQSYVIILTALSMFNPVHVEVTSLQAVSGAGKTFDTLPEMVDNVNPYIDGEEEKSEKEPLKIWGTLHNNKITFANYPTISATCIRVPVADGHMASVLVTFERSVTKEELLEEIKNFKNPLKTSGLPSAPKQLIKYSDEENRPQTRLDRDYANGMGITMGRLRKGKHFDWEFISLSQNTIRGAAGGAILLAELLVNKGYILRD
jgi:aspartate-semialdehyde dehydrogenase